MSKRIPHWIVDSGFPIVKSLESIDCKTVIQQRQDKFLGNRIPVKLACVRLVFKQNKEE